MTPLQPRSRASTIPVAPRTTSSSTTTLLDVPSSSSSSSSSSSASTTFGLLTPPLTPVNLADAKRCMVAPGSTDSSPRLSTVPSVIVPATATATAAAVESLEPRRQRLRAPQDQFTPSWVRGQGLEKEGWCDECCDEAGGGRWFKLKDGSYWYHRQFVHGVSSISGQRFVEPIETRCAVDERGRSRLEGLCGTCADWTTYETYRFQPTTTTTDSTSSASLESRSRSSRLVASRMLWYRHAFDCHPHVAIQAKRSPVRSSSTTIVQIETRVPPVCDTNRSGPPCLTNLDVTTNEPVETRFVSTQAPIAPCPTLSVSALKVAA
ncbi:hypothetical protein JCM10212_003717 [Sporobolomyces blumeae]